MVHTHKDGVAATNERTPERVHSIHVTPKTRVIQTNTLLTISLNEHREGIAKPARAQNAFDVSHTPYLGAHQPAVTSTPKEVNPGIPLETFAATNQQLI